MATITPALCRAARGLLGWNQDDLARAARVGLNTLRNFEGGKSAPMANNLKALEDALEAAGVLFIPENGGGAGLRLQKPRPWQVTVHDEKTAEVLATEHIRDDGEMLARVRNLKASGIVVRVYGGTDERAAETLAALRDLGASRN